MPCGTTNCGAHRLCLPLTCMVRGSSPASHAVAAVAIIKIITRICRRCVGRENVLLENSYLAQCVCLRLLASPRCAALMTDVDQATQIEELAFDVSSAEYVDCVGWLGAAVSPAMRARLAQVALRCTKCPPSAAYAAWFDADTPEIVVCFNKAEAASRGGVQQLVKHEMIHATDVLLEGCDLDNDDDLTCTEIRANHWGDCGHHSFAWLRRRCTRSAALASLANNFDRETASALLLRNFERCIDKRDPF